MALTGLLIWLAVLTAAGLCFPRRPHITGILFILLGVWSSILRLVASGSARPVPWFTALGMGAVWFAIGISHIRRYADPHTRAAHVKSWTA